MDRHAHDPTPPAPPRPVPADPTAAWLASVPDVVARLEAVRHPLIAVVGCGTGAVALRLALAFLDAHIDGTDRDGAMVARARSLARRAGLDGRVRFAHADGPSPACGPYHLVVLPSPDRVPRPAVVLREVRGALAHGATVLVAGFDDPRAPAREAGYRGVSALGTADAAAPLHRLHP